MIPATEAPYRERGYYVFDAFKTHTCTAAFSTNRFDLGFHNNVQIKHNRDAFLRQLDIDSESLVCLQQVHGNKVFIAHKKDKGRGAWDYAQAVPGYDGIITQERNLPLAVFSADCLSVFMLDIKKRVVSVLHSGWRGTKDNIVGVSVDLMKRMFSSRPEDIICGLGPGIRSCCYEVGPEFKEYFAQGLVKREGKLFLDLVGANLRQGKNAGVPDENIFDCGICTSCQNKDFFSYRRSGMSAGRMMSVIILE